MDALTIAQMFRSRRFSAIAIGINPYFPRQGTGDSFHADACECFVCDVAQHPTSEQFNLSEGEMLELALDPVKKAPETAASNAKSSPLCKTCIGLDLERIFQPRSSPNMHYNDLAYGPHELRWDLRTVRNAKACLFCQLLSRVLEKTEQYKSLSEGDVVGRVEGIADFHSHKYRASGTTGRRLWIVALPKDFLAKNIPEEDSFLFGSKYDQMTTIYETCIQLSNKGATNPIQEHLLKGRPIGTSRIDLDLLQNWLHECEQTHGDSCSPRQAVTMAGLRFRVLDVRRRCVIQAPPNCRYVALSYVWGERQQLQLTSKTFTALQTENSVTEDTLAIPLSIRDAISVCKALNEQFLWVDSLCIQQDDEEDRVSQIRSMGSIYNQASLTLVSAAGKDADAGLPGVRPHSRPEATQASATISGLPLITTIRNVSMVMRRSKWSSRAWTMQEEFLSKRLLIFTETMVYFYCCKSLRREDMVLESCGPDLSPIDQRQIKDIPNNRNSWRFDLTTFPNELTPKDAFWAYMILIPAFAARKLTHEEDALNSCQGMLEPLVTALGPFIWGLPERRLHMALTWSRFGKGACKRRMGFPSWSWTGWQFEATNLSWRAEHTHNINPVIRWHRNESGKWIALELPEINDVSSDLIIEPKIQPHFYSGETPPAQPPFEDGPCLANLIGFHTSSASFNVLRRHGWRGSGRDGEFGEGGYQYDITDQNDRGVGAVILPFEWRERAPDQIEFIVVAMTGKMNAVGKPDSDYMFMTIVVEWNDSIAYRIPTDTADFTQKDWLAARPERKFIVMA